jgi:hypothetical protein
MRSVGLAIAMHVRASLARSLRRLGWLLLMGALALGQIAVACAARAEAPADLVAACKWDALRWCPVEAFSRDPRRIGRCMRAHRERLSEACQAAARRHGL